MLLQAYTSIMQSINHNQDTDNQLSITETLFDTVITFLAQALLDFSLCWIQILHGERSAGPN